MVDLLEIGAGGGSIAELDQVGLLRVGPRSAGAEPGPACYRLGGSEPTVTDANVVLGLISPDSFLGGSMQLDSEAACGVIAEKIAQSMGIDPVEAAAAIHRVVTDNMAEATRVHSAELNVDLRNYSLVAYGGAGPLHAYGVAERLGLSKIVFPRNAGVLSATGHDDPCALRCQLQSGGLAQAARCRRYDCRSSSDAQVHSGIPY